MVYIGRICSGYLTTDSIEHTVLALLTSYMTLRIQRQPLKRIQIKAAFLITQTCHRDHITPVL